MKTKWIFLILILLTFVHTIHAQKIIRAEYFFDTDPGQGNGSAIAFSNQGDSTLQTFSVSTSGLSGGLHQLFVRVQDSLNKWSIAEARYFRVNEVNQNFGNATKITKAEYFFDTDPGQGNATPLNFSQQGDSVLQTFSVSTSGLSNGLHYFFLRVKDSLNQWSIAEARYFRIFEPSNMAFNASKLVNAEYFFDTDPGLGNGTSIPIISGDSVTKNYSVPLSGLSIGFHYFSVRFQDSLGNWGLGQSSRIYVSENQTMPFSSKLTGLEYFFDTDPGVGSGTSIPISLVDSINQSYGVSMLGLDTGYHMLYVRMKDSIGAWSVIASDTFHKNGCNQPIADFQVSNICLGDTLFISNTTSGADTLVQYQWDFGNDGNYDFSSELDTFYIFNTEGQSQIKLKATNSAGLEFTCPDTIVKTVTVYPLPTTNVTTFGNTTFCQGNDVPLSANYGLGWTYQWFKNDTSIINATNTLYNATETGDFSVEITSFYGCIDISTSTSVIVNPLPTATITSIGATNICQGTSLTLDANTGAGLTYVWKKNGSVLTGITSSSITVSEAGNYTVDITNTNGCTNTSAPFAVSVQPVPNAVITSGGSSTICQGDQLNFYGPSGAGYSYQWIKDGQAISGGNSVYYPITQTGNYQVIVSNSSLCTDTSVIQSATVNPSPTSSIIAQGATVICQGDSVLLDAQGSIGYSYQWKNYGLTLTGSTDSNFYAKQSGNYSLITTNTYNCSTESSAQTITVNSLPGASILPMSSTSFCNGDSVNLQANFGSGLNYQWLKNGVPLTGDTNNLLSVFSSGSYTVEVENANNCNSLSVPAIINVYAVPNSAFTLPTTTCASDTAIIQYTGTASSGAFYNWNFGGGTVISGTGQGPYGVKWNTAGNKQISLIVSENGCASAVSNSNVNVNAITAIISSANTSVCNGDSIFITANSGPDFIYQWLQGGVTMTGETSSFLNISNTGNYQVNITDTILGCSQISNTITANVFTNDFNLAFSGNTTSFSQSPFDVSFSNSTPNMSDYQFEWDFGDGNTSNFYQPFHSYQYNGDYSVQLYAENVATGCKDTLIKTDYISCTGGAPNPCNIVAAISPAGPAIICNGDSVMLTASAGTGYIYQWARNGLILTSEDSIVLWAKQAGNYRVIITDSICSQTSPPFVLNHYPSIQPQILVNGSIQPCTDDSLELYLPTSYINYNWSTGDTTPGVFVSQTGYYTVSVTDHYGCNMTSQPETVNASFLSPPEVCIVGVDSNYNNRIIWERPVNDLIDSIYVYRESIIAGQYNVIGALSYSDFGLFSDTNSNPAIRSYRYRLAALDTCGAITLMSTYHKTIHLTINAGLNGSWNLIWDGYSGFPFGSYRIYRGTSTSNMSLLTQLPSTSTSYTDLNPPSGTVYYQIEVVKSSGCYPDSTFTKANTNYNSSRSNVANNGNIAPIYLNADFTANTMTGQWPIQVSFTDISSGNPTSWIWNFGDGNLSIERNPKHTYNNTGLYDIKLIACNGNVCDTTIKQDYINVLPNGMVEIDVELSAKIYPNPNDGSFTLQINSKKAKDATVYIYNNIGQLVYSEDFNISSNTYKKLDLSSQAKGIYHVHLSTDKGVVYREKVVVQ